MKKILNNVEIEIVQGDITRQSDMEAIVNAANARLLPGGGVAGAIYTAAGPELVKESEPLGPLQPGQAVITSAYNLPNRYIIHCLGPVFGKDKPEHLLLADCFINSLQLAERKSIGSIAFPAISTGAFGYPVEGAAAVALSTIVKQTASLKSLKIIRIVLYGELEYKTHVDKLNDMLKQQ